MVCTLEGLAAKLEARRISIYHTADNPDLAIYGAWRAHVPGLGTLYGETWLSVAQQVSQLELVAGEAAIDPWQLRVTQMLREIESATSHPHQFYSDKPPLPAVMDTDLKRIIGEALYRRLMAPEHQSTIPRILLQDGRWAWVQGPVKHWVARQAPLPPTG